MIASFTDQATRLRRIVENALNGAAYEASHYEEDGRHLVIDALRTDGRHVHVRFRGVQAPNAPLEPRIGDQFRLRDVDSPYAPGLSGLLLSLGVLWPFGRRRNPVQLASRVSIDAGPSRLQIVCEDAEWWED
jgi:hypothetical protein